MADDRKVLPVLFGVISMNFPAGLVLYFLVSNLWRLGQQEVIFRKIHLRHRERAGRPTKSCRDSRRRRRPRRSTASPPKASPRAAGRRRRKPATAPPGGRRARPRRPSPARRRSSGEGAEAAAAPGRHRGPDSSAHGGRSRAGTATTGVERQAAAKAGRHGRRRERSGRRYRAGQPGPAAQQQEAEAVDGVGRDHGPDASRRRSTPRSTSSGWTRRTSSTRCSRSPRRGLLGRLGGREARIRARVKPISREKPGDRRRRRPEGPVGVGGAAAAGRPGTATGRDRRRPTAGRPRGVAGRAVGEVEAAKAPTPRPAETSGNDPPRTEGATVEETTCRSRSRPRRPRVHRGLVEAFGARARRGEPDRGRGDHRSSTSTGATWACWWGRGARPERHRGAGADGRPAPDRRARRPDQRRRGRLPRQAPGGPGRVHPASSPRRCSRPAASRRWSRCRHRTARSSTTPSPRSTASPPIRGRGAPAPGRDPPGVARPERWRPPRRPRGSPERGACSGPARSTSRSATPRDLAELSARRPARSSTSAPAAGSPAWCWRRPGPSPGHAARRHRRAGAAPAGGRRPPRPRGPDRRGLWAGRGARPTPRNVRAAYDARRRPVVRRRRR